MNMCSLFASLWMIITMRIYERRMKVVVALVAASLIFSPMGFASTDELLSNGQIVLTKEQLEKVYEERAFLGSADNSLIRPPTNAPLNIMVQCVSAEPCDSSLSLLQKYFKSSWVEPKLTKNFNQEALIHVFLFSNPEADEERIGPKRDLTFPVGTKTFSNGVADCNFSSFVKDHTVEGV